MADRWEVEDLFLDDDNVIEIYPADLDQARRRARDGLRYLGLVEPSEHEALVRSDPQLSALIAPLSSVDQVLRNNADVLILNREFARMMWASRIGGARLVLYPATGFAGLEGTVARFAARTRQTGTVSWSNRRYRVVEQWTTDVRVARHYASPALGLEALAESLADEGIRYAVLRWFEDLPHMEPGEDIDMLVDDAHLEEVCRLLDQRPGTIPCDVYSVTGLPGTDFRSVAYYPPALATGLLDRSVTHDSGFCVPSPADYFRSLAYHALYHKGDHSGVPTELDELEPVADPEHDYAQVLAGLSSASPYDGPITMESLDQHLADVGWRPPQDTLGRLAIGNDWIRARFFGAEQARPEPARLAVFVLRQRASDGESIAMAQAALEEWGFEVVATEHLDPASKQRVEHGIRGGNWGPGPYPTSGGPPSVVIVAVDDDPELPNEDEAAKYPGLANLDVLRAKLTIRDRFLSRVAEAEHCNPVHSSDNEHDAWSYIEIAWPDRAAEIRATVGERLSRQAVGRPRKVRPTHDPLATPPPPSAKPSRLDRTRIKRSLLSSRARVVGAVRRRRMPSIRATGQV